MGRGTQVPLLLVDGHNLLWGATFGFPAPIYSRDKTRLLTGLFAFYALLRVAIRDDVPSGAPEVIVVFDGEYGAVGRQQTHDGYKASRPTDDQALAPLLFLPDVKRGLDRCGIAWIELEHAEADDVIATLVATTTAPRQVIIMSRDRDYYQLITDRVVVLNTRFRAGRKLVTPEEVYARHQVTPAQWADFRALAGDTADEIPGVRGSRVYTCDGYHNLRRDGRPLHLPVIVDITSVWDTKIRALTEHISQPIAEHFGPMAETLARLHGGRIGVRYAEAFAPVPVLGRLPASPYL